MLKRLILHLIANAAALYLTFFLLQGNFAVTGGIKGYLLAGVVFGVLNSFVKPILKILSLPFMLITAGLFTLIINMAIVRLAEYAMNILQFQGVAIVIAGGFFTYILSGLVIGLCNLVIHWLIKKD